MKNIIKHDFITGITHIKKLKFKKINKFNLLILILLFCLVCSNFYQYRALKRQCVVNVKVINSLNTKEKEIISLQEQINELNKMLIVKDKSKKEIKKNNNKKD